MQIRMTAVVLCCAAAGFAAESGSGVAQVADAVRQQDQLALRHLLQQKADVNAALTDGSTALHWAVENDDPDTVDLLLKAGANPNIADRYNITPLYYASTNGNATIVRKLLEAGANPNTTDKYGDTALMAAARAGNADTVALLLGHDASVNARDKSTEQTALMWAARSNHPAAAQVLLEHGAEVNARTRTGQSPARRLPRTRYCARRLAGTRRAGRHTGRHDCAPVCRARRPAGHRQASGRRERGCESDGSQRCDTPVDRHCQRQFRRGSIPARSRCGRKHRRLVGPNAAMGDRGSSQFGQSDCE